MGVSTKKVINVTVLVQERILDGLKTGVEEIEIWVDGKLLEGREAKDSSCVVYQIPKGGTPSVGLVMPIPF